MSATLLIYLNHCVPSFHLTPLRGATVSNPIPRGFRHYWPFNSRTHIHELHEVLRKQQVQEPIKRHPYFLFKARELAQINRSPQPPRYEAGKVHSHYPCDAGAFADRSQRSNRLEFEPSPLATIDSSNDVLSHNFSLAYRVLSSWWTRLARCRIGYSSTIAERPNTRKIFDFKKLVRN